MLSIVIVNYNSGYRLKQAVDACLARPPRTGLQLIVVENESKDASARFLNEPAYASVEVVRPGVNVGYTQGNNIGYANAKGDVVLLMTPDRYPLDDALDRMATRFAEDATIGAIGGFCYMADGKVDHHFLELPTVWHSYLFAFWRTRGAKRLRTFRRYLNADVDLTRPFDVPQPAGGCYAFRREIISNPIQHPGFGLYYSDVDTARKVADTGLRTVVYPDIRFVHDHDEKPPHDMWGPLMTLDFYVGNTLYHRLHNGFGAYVAVKALFTLQLSAWMLRDTAALLVGRQNLAQYKRHVSVFWNFLRDRNVVAENTNREMRANGLANAT